MGHQLGIRAPSGLRRRHRQPITPTTVLKGKPHIGIGFDLASPGADAIIRSLGLDYNAIRNGSAKITLIQAQQVLARTLQTAIAGGRRLVPPFDSLPDDKIGRASCRERV